MATRFRNRHDLLQCGYLFAITAIPGLTSFGPNKLHVISSGLVGVEYKKRASSVWRCPSRSYFDNYIPKSLFIASIFALAALSALSMSAPSASGSRTPK